MPVVLSCVIVTSIVTHFSTNKRQDMHLPRLALFNGGDDEASAAQDDLSSGPAVDRQLKLPFSNVVCPRQLDPLWALDTLRFPWEQEKKRDIVWLAACQIWPWHKSGGWLGTAKGKNEHISSEQNQFCKWIHFNNNITTLKTYVYSMVVI